MKTPYERLAKIYTNCTGHITKMATMPIYGKTHLNIFFPGTKGQWPWYVALGMWALPDLRKRWIYVDLDLLYGKVKFDS